MEARKPAGYWRGTPPSALFLEKLGLGRGEIDRLSAKDLPSSPMISFSLSLSLSLTHTHPEYTVGG